MLVRYLFLILLIFFSHHISWGEEYTVVDTIRQHYSYADLMEDLDSLQSLYPECIRYELRDSTLQGRPIPVVYFGERDDDIPQKVVMIQASMHAREYMTAQLVMSMLEHYAACFCNNDFYKTYNLHSLFQHVMFVIMPMVNPDGVEIAQNGEAGVFTDEAREWVRGKRNEGIVFDQIKSNARGVDINRNFSNGFGKAKFARKEKDFYHYPGPEPNSEVESKLMLAVSKEFPYVCFLNYHTSGEKVYYGCMNAAERVNKAALCMSQAIKRCTNYPLYGPNSAHPSGTWADEVEKIYLRPSATIEIGSKNPVPIHEFQAIYEKNLWVWAELAIIILNEEI